MKLSIIFTIILLCSANLCHADTLKLFKEYNFGMSREEVEKATTVGNCEDEDLADALCATKRIEFAGAKWEQVFNFNKNRLISVVLAKEFDPQDYINVIHNFASQGYTSVYIENHVRNFDVIPNIYSLDKKSFLENISKFETDCLEDGSITYTFIPKKFLDNALANKTKNFLDLARTLPQTVRVIQLLVEDEGMAIIFTIPKTFTKSLINEAQKFSEEF